MNSATRHLPLALTLLLAAAALFHVEMVFRQGGCHRLTKGLVVVNDENAMHGVSPLL